LANRIRKKSHAVLQLRDVLELKGRPAPRDTRQTDIKVLCTLRLARIFATWSLQVDGTIRAPREIRDVIDASLVDASPKPRARSTTPVGEVDLSVASAQERCRREDERSSVL
jgi:hypothetical protein